MAAVLTVNATPEQIRDWRKTRAWRNLARDIVTAYPTCHLRVPGICTIRSTTADHIVPVATRPDLAMERSLLRGACKPCNDWRQDMPIAEVRARIAAGTIRLKRVTPDRARRRMTSRRRPARAPTAFFTTTPKSLQRNTIQPTTDRQNRCATNEFNAKGVPVFLTGPSATGTVAADLSTAKSATRNRLHDNAIRDDDDGVTRCSATFFGVS